MEAGRNLGDLVAVAHPHIEAEHAVVIHVVFDAVEQLRLADQIDAGIAELANIGALHLAAELLGHGLHAIADAEQRHTEIEHRLRRARAAFLVNRLRAAGEDDAAWREGTDVVLAHVPRMQLAVHADLAHAAGDQLGVLGTEVENQNAVSVDVRMRHGAFLRKELEAESRKLEAQTGSCNVRSPPSSFQRLSIEAYQPTR